MRSRRRQASESSPRASQSTLHWLEEAISRIFAWLLTTVYRLTGDWRGWRPILSRGSAHLAVLTLAVTALALSGINWSTQAVSTLSMPDALSAAAGSEEATDTEASKNTGKAFNSQLAGFSPVSSNSAAGSVTRLAHPHTTIPNRPRLEVVTYTVQAGDTVQSIAEHFGLEPTTIMWANPAVEDAPDLLRLGQELIILPIDGVYHTVAEGDTLESIAEEYEVEPVAIVDCQYNDLAGKSDTIAEGEHLIVPGGEKPYEPKVVTSYTGAVPEGARGTGRFQWPVLGRLTQGYWYGHRAIDIGAPTGSALQAADGGFVSFAGWTDVGYGYLVVIDHANGFATYYAHLSNIYVFEGQAVERGQIVGAIGNTGHSTGPHLHFEVRYNGAQHNPRAYLP